MSEERGPARLMLEQWLDTLVSSDSSKMDSSSQVLLEEGVLTILREFGDKRSVSIVKPGLFASRGLRGVLELLVALLLMDSCPWLAVSFKCILLFSIECMSFSLERRVAIDSN